MTVLEIAHPAPVAQLRDRLAAAGYRGELEADLALCAAMSTDNSVYRIAPDMVAFPRDEADTLVLLGVLDEPRFRHIPVTARGGGTGTNGQSLNGGLIVCFQRHMTRLLDLDVAAGWVDVEPGIVLDELNEQLAAHGVFFAPNTSTSSRCTIGGMIATDASGKGSRTYGKTSDNVIGLRLSLAGGRMLDSLSPPPDWAAPMLGEIAAASRDGRAALIASTPDISRRFTGYDLVRTWPEGEGPLDWWRLVPGSEGTLGLVTRARLKLLVLPRHKRLVVLAFASFADALAAGPAILTLDPLAIEVMDEWVQRLALEAGLIGGLPPAVRGSGEPIAYSFVEFAGNSADELARAVDGLVTLGATLPGLIATHVAAAGETAKLWSVRSASVGLLGNSKGRRRPVAFVEDCVVPVENLVPFVRDFDAALRGRGLEYGIYGHVDVGCLHVRPALDIDAAEDRALLKDISDAVYALTRKHGGIFWGEHGKGVRGAYLRDFVGETAYASFQRIKAAFDPSERFNPGKLVSLKMPLRAIATTPFRHVVTPPGDRLAGALACNGNAQCLSYQSTTAMCPSFKATRDLRHSPKGRAEALRAWREAGQGGDRAAIAADTFEALDLCLGCKACAGICPAHVDIPAMKSAFLEDYYATRRRPLADLAAISLEPLSPLLAALPPLARAATTLAFPMAERLLGFWRLPALSARSVRAVGYPLLSPPFAGTSLPANAVLLVQDAFTSLFDIDALAAVADGLAALGYAPLILPLTGGGKAAHVRGARRSFLRQARRQIGLLADAARAGRPMVGVDASFVLMLRQEYRDAELPPAPPVQLVQEFLAERRAAGDAWPRSMRSLPAQKLFLHCTENATARGAGTQWAEVMQALGLPVEIVATGCCGMAGLFGHEARHAEVSRQLFDLSWAKPVAGAGQIYASGFSCRCQVERFSDTRAKHPMALVAAALGRR